MRILLIVTAALLTLSSCHYMMRNRVDGDGKITTQDRKVSSFQNLEVHGNIKVHLKQNSVSAVKLETDANLMEYIEVNTNGNTLVIRPRQGYSLDATGEIIAYVSTPEIKDIDLSGACDIISDGEIRSTDKMDISASGSSEITMQVSVPKLTTDLSGSGTINLKGMAAEFHGSISGSGELNCLDLLTNSTELDLSGSADADVNAVKSLDVEVSGAGTVRYRGNPSVNQRISGSGSVKKLAN